MAIPNVRKGLNEDREYITNYDLTSAAHQLLGGIELDVASSKVANEYIQAENFFTPTDDGCTGLVRSCLFISTFWCLFLE